MGSVAILNVGAGDTKLTFDKSNPAESIRAARIVKDMLRRGYALLVEVEREGKKAFERALDFREDTCEYVIADFDPVVAEEADAWGDVGRIENREQIKLKEAAHGQSGAITTRGQNSPPSSPAGKGKTGKKVRRPYRKSVPASGTRAIAVARSAGG
jgi:hypothetical protein